MEYPLIRKNLHWTVHLLWMPTNRLPWQVLYSPLTHGRREHGHPCLRYTDTIKMNIKKTDLDTKLIVSIFGHIWHYCEFVTDSHDGDDILYYIKLYI